MGEVKFFFDNGGNITPPFLSIFGEIDPGAGKLADAKVLDILVNFGKTRGRIWPEGDQ